MFDAFAPIEVFCSYAHADESHLRQLEKHLSLLKQQGLISTWDTRQIVPGSHRAKMIDQQLTQATLILLIVSADFLASNYQVEMKLALEQHEAGPARVIPIIVRPCDWSSAPFAMLECLPRNKKAITTWDNRDLAWNEVAIGIRQTIKYMRRGNIPEQPPSSPKVDTSNAGILSLEKGSKALWDEGFTFAKKELRKAVTEIDEEKHAREASKARYFLALALLGGKLPRIQGREIMQRIEELMSEAIKIHPYASYYRIFACIKRDFFKYNGFDLRLKNEVSLLESKGASFPRCLDDEEIEEYFHRSQPRLSI